MLLHLRFVGYLLVLACGFAGLTLTAILWSRVRSSLLFVVLIVLSLFFLGLLLSVVLFYVSQILLYPIALQPATAAVNLVLTVSMYGAMAIIIRRLAPRKSLVALGLLAIPVVATYVVFGVLPPASPRLAEWIGRVSRIAPLITVLAPSAYLGYAGFVVRAESPGAENAAVRFMLFWLGTMLVGFSLAAVITTAVTVAAGAGANPTDLLNNLLFLGWNIVAVAAFIKHLVHPADILESGEADPATLKRFGISEREAEVIARISEGLSNKEVADRLNISFTTVRTHVYNIYRKTGAKSRVELLRILSGKHAND